MFPELSLWSDYDVIITFQRKKMNTNELLVINKIKEFKIKIYQAKKASTKMISFLKILLFLKNEYYIF